MELVVTRDAEHFAAAVDGFLAERLETNVLATRLDRVLRGDRPETESLFAYAAEGGRIHAAALCTPPWPLLVSPTLNA